MDWKIEYLPEMNHIDENKWHWALFFSSPLIAALHRNIHWWLSGSQLGKTSWIRYWKEESDQDNINENMLVFCCGNIVQGTLPTPAFEELSKISLFLIIHTVLG